MTYQSRVLVAFSIAFPLAGVWGQNQSSALVIEKGAIQDAVVGPKRKAVEAPIDAQDLRVFVHVSRSLYTPEKTNLRIRNLSTGREVQIEVDAAKVQYEITDELLAKLTDDYAAKLVLEFSVLDIKTQTKRRFNPEGVSALSSGSSKWKKSEQSIEIIELPTWVKIDFYSKRRNKGRVDFFLSSEVQTTYVSDADVEAFKEDIQKLSLQRLFKIGWKAIKLSRYEIAIEAFQRTFSYEKQFTPEQKSEASLGLAVARFHQESCADDVMNLLTQADLQSKYRDDVQYYRSRCYFESRQYDRAQSGFRALVSSSHPQYSDTSRLFLAMIDDELDRFDQAETGYLDVIDFVSNTDVVETAQYRLKILQRKRSDYYYDHKWFNAALTLGSGYDTNVISQPNSVSASSLNLKKKASGNLLNLAYVELQPPWRMRTFNQKIAFTFLNLHYFEPDTSKGFDIQSYDVGNRFETRWGPRNLLELGVNYNSIYSGRIETSTELMAVPGGDFKYKRVRGPLSSPDSETEFLYKLGFVRPKVSAITDDLDAKATSHSVGIHHLNKSSKPHVYGPGLDMEYKLAAGKENSLYSGTFSYRWDALWGALTKLGINQEVSFQYLSKFKSESKQKDYLWRYTISLGRTWGANFDTRVQTVLSHNHSSLTEKRYQKIQLNLLLSLFY